MRHLIHNIKTILVSFLILPIGLMVFPASLGAAQSVDNNDGTTSQPQTTTNQRFDEILAQQNDLTIFRAISKAGNLENTLSSGGPYTLFIPNDEALKGLSKESIVRFSENRGYIEDTLRNHIVASPITTEDVNRGSIRNELGRDLPIERSGEVSRVGGQRILRSIPYNNGIIYVIDGVILP